MYGLGVITSVLAHFGLPGSPTDVASGALNVGETVSVGTPYTTDSINVTAEVNGHRRWFLVNVPWNYTGDVARPLILSFHGNLKNATSQETLCGLSDPSKTPGWFVVYPQGAHDSWEGPNYARPWAHDLTFVTAILAHMRSTYSIDDARIYATGKSNGAGFVGTLACSPVGANFAAFAPVSGAYYTDNGGDVSCAKCTPPTDRVCHRPKDPIPILEFHGTDDRTIPYGGGAKFSKHGIYSGTVPPIPEYLTSWAERYNCPLAPNNHTIAPPMFDGKIHITDYGCGAENLVRAIKVDGMGHCWPWTVQNPDQKASAGCGPTKLNATDIIVEFFKRIRKA